MAPEKKNREKKALAKGVNQGLWAREKHLQGKLRTGSVGNFTSIYSERRNPLTRGGGNGRWGEKGENQTFRHLSKKVGEKGKTIDQGEFYALGEWNGISYGAEGVGWGGEIRVRQVMGQDSRVGK